MKTVYIVEIKGDDNLHIFSREQDAQDYAGIMATFGGRKYKLINKTISESKFNNLFKLEVN